MSVMVLINFSTDTNEGNFRPINVVLSVVSVGVYAIFLVNQMGPYRCFFMDPHEFHEQQPSPVAIGWSAGGDVMGQIDMNCSCPAPWPESWWPCCSGGTELPVATRPQHPVLCWYHRRRCSCWATS